MVVAGVDRARPAAARAARRADRRAGRGARVGRYGRVRARHPVLAAAQRRPAAAGTRRRPRRAVAAVGMAAHRLLPGTSPSTPCSPPSSCCRAHGYSRKRRGRGTNSAGRGRSWVRRSGTSRRRWLRRRWAEYGWSAFSLSRSTPRSWGRSARCAWGDCAAVPSWRAARRGSAGDRCPRRSRRPGSRSFSRATSQDAAPVRPPVRRSPNPWRASGLTSWSGVRAVSRLT